MKIADFHAEFEKAYPDAVTLEEMQSRSRKDRLTEARIQLSAFLYESGWGYTKIGRLLGRTHASIWHYIQRHPHIMTDRHGVERYREFSQKLADQKQTGELTTLEASDTPKMQTNDNGSPLSLAQKLTSFAPSALTTMKLLGWKEDSELSPEELAARRKKEAEYDAMCEAERRQHQAYLNEDFRHAVIPMIDKKIQVLTELRDHVFSTAAYASQWELERLYRLCEDEGILDADRWQIDDHISSSTTKKQGDCDG
jgi:hypothetical protein